MAELLLRTCCESVWRVANVLQKWSESVWCVAKVLRKFGVRPLNVFLLLARFPPTSLTKQPLNRLLVVAAPVV